MSNDDFYSRHKISKLYSYKEIPSSGNTVEFGWFDSDDIDLSGEVVVAYHSRTKKASSEDIVWSKSEGNSATTLSDYKRYFVRSTGFQPHEFIEIYNLDKDSLLTLWSKHGEYNSDTVDFLYSLSQLIVNKKKFIHLGRGYKIIEP